MLECISRRSSPEYLLQAKIECVFQSVQYNVSPNSVKAKGCGREPLTTACLVEYKEKSEYSNTVHDAVLLKLSLCRVSTVDQNLLLVFGEQVQYAQFDEQFWTITVLFSGCLLVKSKRHQQKSLLRLVVVCWRFQPSISGGLDITMCNRGEHQLILCKFDCNLQMYDVHHCQPQQILN